MKRDWDVIREVLLEVQDMSPSERADACYALPYRGGDVKAIHAFMLSDAGFLKGISGDDMEGRELLEPDLTWEGRDLLANIESKPIWTRVKARAAEEGLVMTFDAVKLLAKQALSQVLS